MLLPRVLENLGTVTSSKEISNKGSAVGGFSASPRSVFSLVDVELNADSGPFCPPLYGRGLSVGFVQPTISALIFEEIYEEILEF